MCRWNSHYFTECIIEHTSGSEPATLVKLGDIALVVVYQVLGVKDAVFVQQVLIVAFKVMIDDIRQVGSIRADYHQGNIYKDDFMEVWNNKYQPYRDREWMRKGECADCEFFRYCKGNGMHLRDGKGDLLFCHYKRLQTL